MILLNQIVDYVTTHFFRVLVVTVVLKVLKADKASRYETQ